MSNAIYNSIPSLTTFMSTDLNSLANNTLNIGAVILDNTGNKYFYLGAELYLDTVDLSAQTNPSVELYLVPAIDGTNYVDDGTDGSTTDHPPATLLAGIFAIQETNAVHRASIELVTIGPYKYTPALINKTGAAFAAANNILKMGTFTESVV